MCSKMLITFLTILLFIVKVQVDGSCLEYGHSCWGGHGKRSSSPAINNNNNGYNLNGDSEALIRNKDSLANADELQANALNERTAYYQHSNEDDKPELQMANSFKDYFDKQPKKLANAKTNSNSKQHMRQQLRWARLPSYRYTDGQRADNMRQQQQQSKPQQQQQHYAGQMLANDAAYADFAYYDAI